MLEWVLIAEISSVQAQEELLCKHIIQPYEIFPPESPWGGTFSVGRTDSAVVLGLAINSIGLALCQ